MEIRRVKREETLSKRRGLQPAGTSEAGSSSASAIFASYSDEDEDKSLFAANSPKSSKACKCFHF